MENSHIFDKSHKSDTFHLYIDMRNINGKTNNNKSDNSGINNLYQSKINGTVEIYEYLLDEIHER